MTDPNRPTLEYRPPEPAPKLAAQCFISAVGTAALIIVSVFGVLLLGFAEGESGHGSLFVPVAITVGLGELVGLNYLAYRAFRNPARRGHAFGIWIGFGVAFLIEGICANGGLHLG